MVRFMRGALSRQGTRFKNEGKRPSCSKRLSHADRRDLQRLAVLGDGAARDHDALLVQDFGDFAVGQGSPGVLGGDQLLDERPDGGGGAGAARLGGDVTSEEVLELEDAARRNMNFCVVTRDTVDSCRLSVSAISRSTSGRIATSPCSKKCRCRSTIACDTRRIVSHRCCTFLISQRASCS